MPETNLPESVAEHLRRALELLEGPKVPWVHAQPRRWIVEFADPSTEPEPGTRWMYSLRSVREVKPITRDEISAATVKTSNQYTGGPYNQLWFRMMLKELGIYVED